MNVYVLVCRSIGVDLDILQLDVYYYIACCWQTEIDYYYYWYVRQLDDVRCFQCLSAYYYIIETHHVHMYIVGVLLACSTCAHELYMSNCRCIQYIMYLMYASRHIDVLCYITMVYFFVCSSMHVRPSYQNYYILITVLLMYVLRTCTPRLIIYYVYVDYF